MKLLSGLFLVLLLSSFSFAAPAECVGKLYEYGQGFSLNRFGGATTKKSWETPNPNGAPGEMLHWTTLSSKGNWITTLECDSCSPRKGVTELFLTTKRDLPCGLRNGMSDKDIVQRLGDPYERKEGNLVYVYPPDEGTQEITLQMGNGKLNGIKWHFYVD